MPITSPVSLLRILVSLCGCGEYATAGPDTMFGKLLQGAVNLAGKEERKAEKQAIAA